jgi:hypothetical protein
VLLDPDGEVDVHPGPGNDAAPICFRTRDAGGAALDEECASLDESQDESGRFVATMPAASVADAGAISKGNGTIDLTGAEGEQVEAAYLDTACATPNEVVIVWKGGATDRTLGAFAGCWDGLACDRPHRFTGGVLIDDPPAPADSSKPYETLAADGWASTHPYRSWPSPSFNGLLWVDVSKLSKADPTLDASRTPVGAGMKKLDPHGANMFFPLLSKLIAL